VPSVYPELRLHTIYEFCRTAMCIEKAGLNFRVFLHLFRYY